MRSSRKPDSPRRPIPVERGIGRRARPTETAHTVTNVTMGNALSIIEQSSQESRKKRDPPPRVSRAFEKHGQYTHQCGEVISVRRKSTSTSSSD
ncbi:hypothetical protein QFZ82_006260 [Streptomyces sp. V4I23]|nr:hypothetical protein [Streptomyces sp. V4I23]